MPAPGGPVINRLCPPAAANFDRAFRGFLALYIGKIGILRRSGGGRGIRGRDLLGALEVIDQRQQAVRRQHFDLAGPGGFGPLRTGANQALPMGARMNGGGQHTRDRRDPAIKRELAQHPVFRNVVGGNDIHRNQQAECDWQVIMASLLGEIGGREIDGDAFWRQRQAECMQGGADPLAGLGHRLVGKADDRECGQSRRQLDLNIDVHDLDAGEGNGGNVRDHRLSDAP